MDFLLLMTLSFVSLVVAENDIATKCDVGDCTLLTQLECALYTTDENERKLNQAFFPPRKASTRYIKVIYSFDEYLDDDALYNFDPNVTQNCNVTYIWAIGGFLLIQPPSIFEWTSLLFSYPANDIYELDLTLNVTCKRLVNHNNTNGTCNCKGEDNNNLDILTQQLMQYSKYNNPDSLVRDVTSTAQAICVDDLVSGYYNNANVILYLSVIMILPISTFIVGTSTICLYYDSINKKVQDIKQRPYIVGAAITGLYIVIYIMISDIIAAYYYIEGWDEYNFNSTLHNSLQLKLTWVTLIIEYSTSILTFLICFGFIVSKEWHHFRDRSYHTFKYHFKLLRRGICDLFIIFTISLLLLILSVALIIALDASIKITLEIAAIIISSILFLIILSCYFWLSKGKTIYLISFMVIPAIFVSAHIGYIFAAWLTEPSKTTSVSILALSILLYLFIISRLAYKKVHSHYNVEDERLLLMITFVIVFFGVSLVALNVSAFYILPIPTIELADYLENIFQISLVIFAALISYKILIQEDSEAKKFFKKFNKVFKNDTPFQAKVGTQSKQDSNNLGLDEKEARLCGKFMWGKVRISDPTLDRRYVTCEIEDAILIVQLKGHADNKKSVKIEVENVSLNLGFISSKTKQIRIPLSEAKLSFELVSSNGNEKGTVPLTKACIGYNSVPVSEYELHILCKEREPPVVSLTRAALSCVSEGINICKPNEFKTLKVPLKCFITKTRSGRPGEVYCLLDHFVSLFGKTDRPAKNLITWNAKRINQQILPYSLVNIEISLCGDDNLYDFKLTGENEIFQHRCTLNMEIELKRQFLELRYSISITNYPVQIRHSAADQTAFLEVVYMNEIVLSVPASAKFTTVKLTRYRNNRIRYYNDNNDNKIDVIGDHAFVKFVPGNGAHYEIGNKPIPTATHNTVLLVSTEQGTKLVLSQMFGADTTLKVTQEKVEINYKDEGTVKLNKKHNLECKLELIKIEQDEYPSYLCIPNSESVPMDVFEKAGAAFGEIALAMSPDKK